MYKSLCAQSIPVDNFRKLVTHLLSLGVLFQTLFYSHIATCSFCLSSWEGPFPGHVAATLICAAGNISCVLWAREDSGSSGSVQAGMWILWTCYQGIFCFIWNSLFLHLFSQYTWQHKGKEKDLNQKTLVSQELEWCTRFLRTWALKYGALNVNNTACVQWKVTVADLGQGLKLHLKHFNHTYLAIIISYIQ